MSTRLSSPIFFRLLILCLLPLASSLCADDAPQYTRKEDVIYGRKFGIALTLDVITPKEPNGIGILWMISGGWYSDHNSIRPESLRELLARGYTLFAVVHGSQPKFTIPEIVDDVRRAVRFVRHHAADYGVRPDRLGVTGASAGGHLSLMLGTTGEPGSPDAKDPVDRESSQVQAVACFFPPTDFLNYGKTGEIALGRGILKDFRAPFDFHEYDRATKTFVPVTSEDKVLALGRSISPVSQVTADDAPTLIVHGDADLLVPIQQAQLVVEKLKEAGVPATLVVKPGASHGWKEIEKDIVQFADWFDEHLRKKASAGSPKQN
ncbi:MAG TPA: alpha/beta hydrolase [Planctomycetota bacterium]|nr:alpha/beta hydrolase [Planctomycetota bacterium]